MSRSSSSSNGFPRRVNSRLCTCKLPVRVLTSRTLDNLAGRFLVCLNRNDLIRKECSYDIQEAYNLKPGFTLSLAILALVHLGDSEQPSPEVITFFGVCGDLLVPSSVFD
ncbi:hypothetical protein Tco_0503131 [Tanacetum coccineum]